MRFVNLIAAAAVASVLTMPAVAAANPASSLSLTPKARVSGKLGKRHNLSGSALAIVVVAGAAAAAGIVAAASGKNSASS